MLRIAALRKISPLDNGQAHCPEIMPWDKFDSEHMRHSLWTRVHIENTAENINPGYAGSTRLEVVLGRSKSSRCQSGKSCSKTCWSSFRRPISLSVLINAGFPCGSISPRTERWVRKHQPCSEACLAKLSEPRELNIALCTASSPDLGIW